MSLTVRLDPCTWGPNEVTPDPPVNVVFSAALASAMSETLPQAISSQVCQQRHVTLAYLSTKIHVMPACGPWKLLMSTAARNRESRLRGKTANRESLFRGTDSHFQK